MSRFKEWAGADGGHSLNRDFTVQHDSAEAGSLRVFSHLLHAADLLTFNGEHCGLGDSGHVVGGHAAVISRVFRPDGLDLQQTGELIQPLDLEAAAGVPDQRQAVFAPLNGQGAVAGRDRAQGVHAVADGQIAGEV